MCVFSAKASTVHFWTAFKRVTVDSFVALHAYVLMTNHVRLLMTPRDTAGISRTALCSVHQPPVPAHGYAVGRAP